MRYLLKKNMQFAGCTVVRKLSKHHDREREVYLASRNAAADGDAQPGAPEEEECVLTVYNLSSRRYGGGASACRDVAEAVEEVRFLRSRQPDSHFVRVTDCGVEKVGRRQLGWMVQPYVAWSTLTEEIKLQRGLYMHDVTKLANALCDAVEEIRRCTGDGGHYNITTDNVLVYYRRDELAGIWLTGLTDIGPRCLGSVPFSGEGHDIRFTAPETSKGVYGHSADIYALGMVLAMAITGHVGEAEGDFPDLVSGVSTPAEFRDRYLQHHRGRLTTAQRLLLERATHPDPAVRFQTVDRFKSLFGKLSKGKLTTRTHSMERGAKSPSPAVKAGEAAAPKGLDQVAGMAELKALFRRDFIRILRNPQLAKAYGITPGNCTLLYGPQGCGKTFIAEKAAQEAGLKYKIVYPSQLASQYIHGTQQKIAELFDEAAKKAPMILIFDEFDALVPSRDSNHANYQANEVNEMLTQLNNCASRGVYVLATTNRPAMLDPAIMRKGRVDRAVYVEMPDTEARRELFRLEVERRPFADVDYDALASATEHYTCSDISYIVQESARLCFEDSVDKGLSEPLPLSTQRLLDVARATRPSVTEAQRHEYQQLRTRMESPQGVDSRRRVGFMD